MNKKGNLSIEMWAIVLGATNKLLELTMPYGYEVKHLKLKDTPIENDIISNNGKLDIKYIASDLSANNEPEFIFIHKKRVQELPLDYFVISEMLSGNEKAYLHFDNIQERWNHELFIILSMLRLSQEGNIEIADKYFQFHANYCANNIHRNAKSSLDMPISVYGDLYEWHSSNLSIFRNLTSLSEELISKLKDIFERFERGYSSSRFEDSYKNLVTLSEILLIGHNSGDKKGEKKKKFANRIAAAVAADSEARNTQNIAKSIYKNRSDETHEGKKQNIDKEALKELRCLVRKLILNFIEFSKDNYIVLSDNSFEGLKKAYIKQLLNRLKYLNDNGYIDME